MYKEQREDRAARQCIQKKVNEVVVDVLVIMRALKMAESRIRMEKTREGMESFCESSKSTSSEFNDRTIASQSPNQGIPLDNIIKESACSEAIKTNDQGRELRESQEWYQCEYCGSEHEEMDCEAYPDVESRRVVVRCKGLCYCCLSQRHKSTHCFAACAVCTKRHHVSLCVNIDNPAWQQKWRAART